MWPQFPPPFLLLHLPRTGLSWDFRVHAVEALYQVVIWSESVVQKYITLKRERTVIRKKIFHKDSSTTSIAKTSSLGLISSIVSIIPYSADYNFSANIEDLYNGQRSYSPTKTLWYVITVLRTCFWITFYISRCRQIWIIFSIHIYET